MNEVYPLVPLGELLIKSEEWIDINPTEKYKQVTVKIWGKGVVERNEVSGAEIAATKRLKVNSGQFILSRIDARHGAFGLIPNCLNGAVVTNDFPVFTPNNQKIVPQFLDWMSKTKDFIELCKAASEGTTNRVRLKENKFLLMEISLPPLEEQRRIVARIEELAGKIEEVRSLRQKALEETEVLVTSSLSQIFNYQILDTLPSGWKWKYLSELLLNNKEGITTGPFGTLLQKSEIQSKGVPILGIANVQANRFVPGFTDYVSSWKAEMLSSYHLQTDDIVIARSGTVGRSCVVPEGLDPTPILSTNLIRLRLDKEIFLPQLLCRIFNGSSLIENHKDTECRGSTRSFFTQTILLRLQIPVPPLAEQRRIVTYLDELQTKIHTMKQLREEAIKELDALLPSILDKAFKGEL